MHVYMCTCWLMAAKDDIVAASSAFRALIKVCSMCLCLCLCVCARVSVF